MSRRARTAPFPLAEAALACAAALALAACGEEPAPKPAVKVPAPQAQTAPAPTPSPSTAMAPEMKPDPAAARAESDAALAARVKKALLAEPLLKAHGIDVVAKNGAVTLFGTAETKMKRDMAGNVAKAVSGVKSVENRLAVVAGS